MENLLILFIYINYEKMYIEHCFY